MKIQTPDFNKEWNRLRAAYLQKAKNVVRTTGKKFKRLRTVFTVSAIGLFLGIFLGVLVSLNVFSISLIPVYVITMVFFGINLLSIMLLSQSDMNATRIKTITEKENALYAILEQLEKEDVFTSAIPMINNLINSIDYAWMVDEALHFTNTASALADLYELSKVTIAGYSLDDDDDDDNIKVLEIYANSEEDLLDKFEFYDFKLLTSKEVESPTLTWTENNLALVRKENV